jgi:hypothetical protein
VHKHSCTVIRTSILVFHGRGHREKKLKSLKSFQRSFEDSVDAGADGWG